MLKKKGLLRGGLGPHQSYPHNHHNHHNLVNGATIIGGVNHAMWPVNIDPARQCGRCRYVL